ncbi:aspartic proteinase CDR1-like [Tripterygium wilfordii]|uniref:aspartic proteinase CDR1-like n=1 Tax=Tripterygium wilfordii TaxID=458696 RepID=UPI0018F816EF|nr:aspartic proteinase CDR1-like [Tripterygium wilfordii]
MREEDERIEGDEKCVQDMEFVAKDAIVQGKDVGVLAKKERAKKRACEPEKRAVKANQREESVEATLALTATTVALEMEGLKKSLEEAKVGEEEAKLRQENDFSIQLIHRNSPESPFYNSSATSSELIEDAILRSLDRANFFHSFVHIKEKTIVPTVLRNGGDYLMRIYVGSEQVEVLAIADTGSDLIWIRCQPLDKMALFIPHKSTTYKPISHDASLCRYVPKWMNSPHCLYNYTYLDGSFSLGVLSNETFYLNDTTTNGRANSFPRLVFGCGHKNHLPFKSTNAQGIVGLGGGLLSLVSQLKSQNIEERFSYCLLAWQKLVSNKIKFGAGAKITGPGIVSSKLVSKDPSTFYFLSLKSISIGNNETRMSQIPGNIFIDSGTPLTMLHSSLYNDLEVIVKEVIGVDPISNPPRKLKLCYEPRSIKDVSFPEMIFHFDGADLRLLPINTFMEYKGLQCMLIIPDDNISIFGSMAQVNFQIEFDLKKKEVLFAPADCTMFGLRD